MLAERLLAASVDLAVLAVLVGGGIRLLRPRSPRLVALLWLLVMVRSLAGLAAGPLLTLDLPAVTLEAPGGRHRTFFQEVEIHRPLAGGGPLETTETVLLDRESAVGPALALLAGWAWSAVLIGLAVSAVVDRLRLRQLLRGTKPAPGPVQQRLPIVSRRVGVPQDRMPEVLVTQGLDSPALAGTWRPVVLLPSWLAEEGSAEQLDWAVGHEVMHWKAKDHLGSAVRQLFRMIFFFHPAAGWVGRRWEEAAELACDRALVSNEEEAASYAERLYEMLAQARHHRRHRRHRRPAVAGGLFATRTQIGRRIAALLRGPVSGPSRLSPQAAAALGILAALSLAFGASCSRPAEPLLADLELTGPQGSISLEARGRFVLARNQEDVDSLAPGGRMVLRQEAGGESVSMEITSGPDGEVRHVFTVGGERRPYDRRGRAWMASTLPRFAPFLEPRGSFHPMTRIWRRWKSHADRLFP